MYPETNKALIMPTSGVVVLESLVKWGDKLVDMAMISMSGDCECPVILKMSQFNKQKKNNVEWYSDPFYSHNKGYKMCLRIYASGISHAEDTHLSAFTYLMKGPHDNELTWPLRGKFEIKLLNQISDSEHHSVNINYNGNTPSVYISKVTQSNRAPCGWGHVYFISISVQSYSNVSIFER